MLYYCILSIWWLIIWTENVWYPFIISFFEIWPEVQDTLKLVRTPLNVLLHGHFKKYISLYAPITSEEYHAWFYLNAASPAERNTEQVNITKQSCPQ